MLRILHVVTDMGCGGLETMLMNYYRKIDRDNLQFDFLVHRETREFYDDEIESLGGHIFRMPRLNPFSITYKRRIGKFLDEHPEYQIVHVHQDCLSGVFLKVAKKHGVIHRIAHSHSSSQTKNIKYPIKLLFRQSIPNNATLLMACSKAAGDWMFCGNDYQILNNAIDAKSYIYDEELRRKIRKQLKIEDDLLVGHVGRFSTPKNHLFLLDVFNELQKTISAKLLLVGDGGLRKEIEDKISSLGLADKVILLGRRSDVADLLQAMDVFVFPSIYEGLPLTIIEAQAAGLPCLISEKVPIECKKTKLVYQMSLEQEAAEWADCVMKISKENRSNTYVDIRDAGYDSEENAMQLSALYLELERSVCNGM